MENVSIIMNGSNLTVAAGSTILEAAKANGIRIPTLCKYKDLAPKARCRVCIVEVDGSDDFKLSCAVKVTEGMVINTDTPAIINARKATIEKMFEYHSVDCNHCMRIGSTKAGDLDREFCESCFFCDCVREGFCELQALSWEYKVDQLPFEIKADTYELDGSLESVIRNPNKCVKCWRCVEVCGKVQTVNVLELLKLETGNILSPVGGKSLKESPCVRCGRCVDICPTGGVYMMEHKDKLIYYAHKYGITTVAQIGPSIIDELEKLFKMEAGKLSPELIASGLRKIGVDYVVTDDFALAKAEKSVEKVLDEKLSNNSGTVIITNSFGAQNFVNGSFQDLKDSMLIYDSVQQAFGKYVKSEFAETKGLAKKDIRTISISNNNENGAEAQELGSVDFSLNARELYRIFLRSGVNMKTYRPSELNTFGTEEISSKYEKLFKNITWTLDKQYEEVELNVEGKVVKAAIAKNLGQCRYLLEQVSNGNSPYSVIRLNA